MKTRIKIIERNNGTKEYICQEKGVGQYDLILGVLFPVIGWMYLFGKVFYWNNIESIQGDEIYDSLELAKEYLDKKLHAEESLQKYCDGWRVKKITYEKYP